MPPTIKTHNSNSRIAKNTILLFLRMILLMVVSLYTSRITLQKLGVEDYGIYNVVGGVVSMFTILTGSMSSAISRYLTFELGKGDTEKLKTVFSSSLIVLFILSVIVLLLLEPIGIWYVQNKLVMPDGRSIAAIWVLQCSIVAFILNLIRVPYNSLIIAHEKMGVFAYLSIIEAVLKLLIVYILIVIDYDKLIIYAILILCTQIITNGFYYFYCIRNFAECKLVCVFDRGLIKEMSRLASWSFIGILAWIINTNGLNIVLNLFFGPEVNAARGIAVQVQNTITNFYRNFQTAVNPQITKSYSIGDFQRMHSLIFLSSKFSYYLLFLIAFPVCMEADTILSIWLVEVPEQSSIFLILILCSSMIGALTNPLNISAMANGNIKKFQLFCEMPQILVVPLSYFCFQVLAVSAEKAFIISLIIGLIALITKVIMMKSMIKLCIEKYFTQVICPIIKVTLTSFLFSILIHSYLSNSSIFNLLLCLIYIIIILVSIYFLGLQQKEKIRINRTIEKKLHR